MSNYDPREAVGIAAKWWRRMTGDTSSGYQSGDSRATLAGLRRSTLSEAQNDPAVARLFNDLGYTIERDAWRLPRVAVAAIALSCVRHNQDKSFWRAVGRRNVSDNTSATLSLLRFRALVNAANDEEMVTALKRAIAVANETANVYDIARFAMYYDSDPVRNRVALLYYGAGSLSDRDAA